MRGVPKTDAIAYPDTIVRRIGLFQGTIAYQKADARPTTSPIWFITTYFPLCFAGDTSLVTN
jgi:hypothetical protein